MARLKRAQETPEGTFAHLWWVNDPAAFAEARDKHAADPDVARVLALLAAHNEDIHAGPQWAGWPI